VGYFFFINLFIGIVVSTFNIEQDKLGGSDLLTEKQREWLELKLLTLRSAPIKKIKPPTNRFLVYFYKIQNDRRFENFIFGCIILNSILLCLKWYQMDKTLQ
jgi:hypothetical protein